MDAYIKLAKFITPKLQGTALDADEANSWIEVTPTLGGARQVLLNKLLTARGAAEPD